MDGWWMGERSEDGGASNQQMVQPSLLLCPPLSSVLTLERVAYSGDIELSVLLLDKKSKNKNL